MPRTKLTKRAARGRRERFRKRAIRDKKVYFAISIVVVGLLAWYELSPYYHASRIERIPLELDLPAGIDVELTDFRVSYRSSFFTSSHRRRHSHNDDYGYRASGSLRIRNRSGKPVELHGKQLLFEFHDGDEICTSARVNASKVSTLEFTKMLVDQSLDEISMKQLIDPFQSGEQRALPFSWKGMHFLGGVDRLVVRLQD